MFQDGSAPPIYQIRPLLKSFANASSEQEVRRFADVMRNGTDAEQESAVNEVISKFDHK